MLALFGVLLAIGVYDEPVLALLSDAWQTLLAALHLDPQAAALQTAAQRQESHRPSLPGLSYVGFYLGVCLLLLRLLLPQAGQWRLALRLYGGVLLGYVLLQLGSRLGGLSWAYPLSRHLLSFLVSPVPVLALVALLRGARPAAQEQASENSA